MGVYACYYHYLTPLEFFTSVIARVFHWSLGDSKSLQVSRTHLRILAVLSNAVLWIVSTRPTTSKSSRTFNNPLVIVPNAPITIGTYYYYYYYYYYYSREFLTSALACGLCLESEGQQISSNLQDSSQYSGRS